MIFLGPLLQTEISLANTDIKAGVSNYILVKPYWC